jgi:hypothetical protein
MLTQLRTVFSLPSNLEPQYPSSCLPPAQVPRSARDDRFAYCNARTLIASFSPAAPSSADCSSASHLCPSESVCTNVRLPVNNAINDEKVISWIRQRAPETKYMLSVCNGAFIVAKAGLLDGLNATTTAGRIEQLVTEYPKVHVLRRSGDIGRGGSKMSPLRGSRSNRSCPPRLTPWANEIPPLRGYRPCDFFTAGDSGYRDIAAPRLGNRFLHTLSG